MNIGTSNEYNSFIQNMFYHDRTQVESEPTAGGSGDIYYRNTGKLLPVSYDGNYLYVNKLNISVSNNSSPNPMIIGASLIGSSDVVTNFEQDVFSSKFPVRTVSLGGAITKNSQSWKSFLKASLIDTLLNNGDANYAYFPYMNSNDITNLSPIAKSVSIEINKDCNWNIDWEIFDADAKTPVLTGDISLTNPPMDYDRNLKWYDVAVVIPPGVTGLYDKVKFIQNSDKLFFYANNISMTWNIDYDTSFVLNRQDSGTVINNKIIASINKKRIPLINIKRITNKINISGFIPTGSAYSLSMFNNDNTYNYNVSDLFFDSTSDKARSLDGEIAIYLADNTGVFSVNNRIDNLLQWNYDTFNLIDKLEVSANPNEPAKISFSITKIYS